MNDTTNPKDAAGRAKVPLHLWPATATAFGAMGFQEGMLKYGRNNWRATPVSAAVYAAAAKRHIDAWMEGQDNSPDTGNPHLGNALACLAILVDAQVNGTLIDDRNYTPDEQAYERMVQTLTQQVAALQKRFADKTPKHWDRRDNHTQPVTGDRHESVTFGPLGAESMEAPRNCEGLAQQAKQNSDERYRLQRNAAARAAVAPVRGECDCETCQLTRALEAAGHVVIRV